MFLLESADFREFVELLNSHKVKYLIVGGHAVGVHGFPRFTGDLDIWIDTVPDNARRLESVIKDFGFGSLKFKTEDFLVPGYAIQFGREPYRIDILTSISGVEFAKAYPRRVNIQQQKMELPFIGLADLTVNKLATARPKDLMDVAQLQRRSNRKKTSKKH